MASLKRLQREFENIVKDPPSNCSAGLLEDNFYEWEARIIGPSDTPYEGGIYTLRIHIPMDYPFVPPQCQFKTKIYHPNINSSGQICLDILKNQWAPSLTISKVLLSILALMDKPNPEDPLVPEIAREMKTKPEKYKENARNWTLMYAS
jgi:ubiquitin-conjugating enzyme E2 D/E